VQLILALPFNGNISFNNEHKSWQWATVSIGILLVIESHIFNVNGFSESNFLKVANLH
jgi:hypothetical protein